MNNVYLFQFGLVYPGKVAVLPYSIASVWSFAKTNPIVQNEYQLKNIYFIKRPLSEIVDSLTTPTICAFSCYVWNWKYNLELAKQIKINYPDCLIIFGGPQVPDEGLEVFERHPWVDFLVHGEGEYQFLEILLASYRNASDYSGIKGISYINNLDGSVCIASSPSRINDLSTIPSPYLDGTLDSCVIDPDYRYAMVTETNRGCPFQCTFCDWGSLTYQKIKRMPMIRIEEEFIWAAKNQIDEIHLADANFGIFKERDRQIAELFVETKEKYGYPWTISTAWTKNSNSTVLEIAEILHRAKSLRMFQISIQTFNQDSLSSVKRANMDSNKYHEVLEEVKIRKVPHGTELIIGLPLETYDSWIDTIDKVSESDTWFHLSPLTVLVNSEFAQPEYLERYRIKTRKLAAVKSAEDDYIEELQDIVVATSTLSEKDMIKGWGYAWVIYAFHLSGFTNQIAKVLRVLGVENSVFYMALFNWVKKDTSGIFYLEYKRFLDEIEESFSWQKASRYFLAEFHGQRSIVDSLLKQFLEEVYPDKLSAELLDEIVGFQRFSSLESDVSYPVTRKFSCNLLEIIENSSPLKFGSVSIRANNSWHDHPDYLSLGISMFMYRKRRNMPWKNELVVANE